ncbi:MAG: DUF4956 domain-containing protein [Bacteroidetes bacterium]|nr:DUF4956 domain-containing protein [Bacteroidota bacterium]
MNLTKYCIFIFIIFLSLMPFTTVKAQTTDLSQDKPTEIIQQQNENNDNTDNSDIKEKKKKKKNKELQITEAFYIDLLIDILTVLIVIVFIYFRNYRNKELFFTYFIFNIAIFLLTFLLNQVKMSMGAAFGLFAVFSMLRYRTEGISVKDMTYLFIVIAIGLISAIQLDYYELSIINGIIIITTLILDGNILFKHESMRHVLYEKIDLIKSENYDELINDLKNRTGLNIHRVSVNKMDFLKDTASINAYYYAEKQNNLITETER